MRYVFNLPPPAIDVGGKEVKGVREIRPVAPERVRSHLFSEIEQLRLHRQAQRSSLVHSPDELGRRTAYPEDRRKVNLRIRQLPVLIDFRSGIDRRRRHLRAGDLVEHIDEKV